MNEAREVRAGNHLAPDVAWLRQENERLRRECCGLLDKVQRLMIVSKEATCGWADAEATAARQARAIAELREQIDAATRGGPVPRGAG